MRSSYLISLIITVLLPAWGQAQDEETSPCELYYQPLIEVENTDLSERQDYELFYVLDRVKYAPLNGQSSISAGGSRYYLFPPLLAEPGLHILEIYVHQAGRFEASPVTARVRNDALSYELERINPLREPVAGTALPVDPGSETTEGSGIECACLSNAEGLEAAASFWYNFTNNAAGDSVVYGTVLKGEDWATATSTLIESINCLTYAVEMALPESRQQARVSFVPRDEVQIVLANPEDPDRGEQLLVFPNPIVDQGNIRYTLERSGPTLLEVYSTQGLLLSTLVNEEQVPGTYTVAIETKNWPPGIYVARLSTGPEIFTEKLLYIR